MKPTGLGAIFTLFISLAISSYAQQPRQDSGAAAQEHPKPQQQAPPEPMPQQQVPPEAKAPRGPSEVKPPKAKEQEPSPSIQQKPAHKQQGKSVQKQPARPSGKSAHIPDAKFKANFGRQHTFTVKHVVPNTTVIIPNQTQFVYAGYTFIFLDPWPEDWLLTDDCYIDYVEEEYFLFDVFHPGVRVALFVAG